MANQSQPGNEQQRKPFDAGDPESVGEQKREKNSREARKAIAFKTLISDPAGREYVWDLLKDCYIFHTTFTGNAQGYFNEGKRSIGLQVMADLMKTNPEAFATMMRENTK